MKKLRIKFTFEPTSEFQCSGIKNHSIIDVSLSRYRTSTYLNTFFFNLRK